MPRKTPEQINFEKSREESDAGLVRMSAKMVVDERGSERLDPTKDQIDNARREMEYTINDKEKAKQEVLENLRSGSRPFEAYKMIKEWKLPVEFTDSAEVQAAVNEGLAVSLENDDAFYIGNYFTYFHPLITEKIEELAVQSILRGIASDEGGISGPFDYKEFFKRRDKDEVLQKLIAAVEKRKVSHRDNNINFGKKIIGFNDEQMRLWVAKDLIARLKERDLLTIISAIDLKNKYDVPISPEIQESALSAVRSFAFASCEELPIFRREVESMDYGMKIVEIFKIDKKKAEEAVIQGITDYIKKFVTKQRDFSMRKDYLNRSQFVIYEGIRVLMEKFNIPLSVVDDIGDRLIAEDNIERKDFFKDQDKRHIFLT